ncbi:zinc finger C2HC domain-containing protein 1C-like [Stegostoma tigrinum]|uniref:zinc finger C2HC domain-containing protein 1C-like n=1 Tax=Stegostoma tigrinum TaxID=3053191 RepID=UPI00287086F4|nr:zinc finger C2HC domain-containing protein 1C-like [Stegostoma tigrinum]
MACWEMGPYLQIDPLSPYGKNKSSRKLPPISQGGHDISFTTPQTKLDLLKCQIQQKLEREKQVKLMAIYKQQYQEALYRLRTTYLLEAHSGSYRNPSISERPSSDVSLVQSPTSEDQDFGWTQVTLGPQGKKSAGIDRAHPLRPINRRHSGLSNFEGETCDWRNLIPIDAPMWPAVTFRPSPPRGPKSKGQSSCSQLRSRERSAELRTSEDSTSPVEPCQWNSQCNNSNFSNGLESRELQNSQQNGRINIEVEISKKESLIQGRLRKIEEELRLIQMQREETDEEMEDHNMEESMKAERGAAERERSEREMEGSMRERSVRERENSGRDRSEREMEGSMRERSEWERENSGRERSVRERERSGRDRSEREMEGSMRERSEWKRENSGRERSVRTREGPGRESESSGREWLERNWESSGRERSEREREWSDRERSERERSEKERAKRERTDREKEEKEKMLEIEREAKQRQRDKLKRENAKDGDHRTTKSSSESLCRMKISSQYKGEHLTEVSFDVGSSEEYSDHSNPFADYKEIASEEKDDTKNDTNHTAHYSDSLQNERSEWNGHYSPEEKAHCPSCGRRFVLDRLDTHTEICKKVYKRKRKVYDSAQKRAKGTDLENYQCCHKVIPAPRVNWKLRHDAFIRMLHAAQQAELEIYREKKQTMGAASPSANSDYIQCPHCSRRFEPNVAQNHIPKCKTLRSRPAPPKR